MALKENYINGETLSASAFNDVASQVNTNTSQLLGLPSATNANTADTLVRRDASGNFSAGTVTASRLVSTVATGTAPFTVTSTTNVPNLNASQLQGSVSNAGAVASTLALRDANINLTSRGFIPGFTATVTAAGTTTLTIASNSIQHFTGTTTQTCVLPTTSVVAGYTLRIINSSTGAVTVQSSALAAIGAALTTGTSAQFIALVATPTTAANWHRI
jgi:hypothetical protein